MAQEVKKKYHIRNAFNQFWTASGWGEYSSRLIISEAEKEKNNLPAGGFWQLDWL